MNFDAWAGTPTLPDRVRDTRKEIDADPTDITVRHADGTTGGPYRVRIVRAPRAVRERETEGAGAGAADVTIVAPPGTPLRRRDRVRVPSGQAAAGETYVVTFVAPGQEWRVEADAVMEQ